MIITNANSRPSERVIEVLSDYFFKNGYTFKKSQASFVKPFDKGEYVVRLWFKISTLTNVTFSWWLYFEKLAKLHANLLGRPKKYKTFMYMPAGLATHTRWDDNFQHTWNLYSETSLEYTDASINLAAQKLINAYEIYVPNYFKYFEKYESLAKDYNEDEFKSVEGIILAKYFDNPNFESLLLKYEKQIEARENDENGQEHTTLRNLKKLIETEDIKDLI